MNSYADNYRKVLDWRVAEQIMGHDPNDPSDAEAIDRMAWEGNLSDVNVVQHLADLISVDEFRRVREALAAANSARSRMLQIAEEAEVLLAEIAEAALS